ncbi:hypothetical protein K9M79_02960 [Candidatus Woesearchaeota archaeon]|nr:hypothetical protein [Candidatus Woesearchaeota archaeon]
MANPLQRKNDTLASRVNRMTEFYDTFDLNTFEDFVEKMEYNVESSWEFLDMQTRMDYQVTNGKNPIIYDYMERLKKHRENDNY